MINILLVEDEQVLGHLIKEVLLLEPDFAIEWVTDGAAALDSVGKLVPDICILDVMLPRLNGFDVAKSIRKEHAQLPIIFLSARSAVPDVVKGYESGGNDYLRKPFSIKELVLRVKALLQHGNYTGAYTPAPDLTLAIGRYTFCTVSFTLCFGETKYVLTSREGEVLKALILHKNRVMPKDDVLNKIWGINTLFTSRTMDVYIGRLRKYLVHDPAISIKNIRGYGYKLILEDQA
ncbi:response regulator transcription factor [Taibaiella chishuiensis]|uniref:DNA-binding response OmpR family regulator n=1 Tax=Taibaiella chishuiensis TaxID=1434707 RepID=A0A2P8CZI3_9BACT|nr:response regulator transcription factor [Taibaiella chishuiensis]PSK90375.1 DNA-binding response OmpR family regulator [Taibaiella chishuiensis]